MASSKKKPLAPDELQVCRRLKALWDQNSEALGLTQEIVAEKLEISQGGVSHYLNGRNAVGFEAIFWWAQLLKVHPYQIDPHFGQRLPDDLRMAVDNMLVGGSPVAREAYRSIVAAALKLHEEAPASYISSSAS